MNRFADVNIGDRLFSLDINEWVEVTLVEQAINPSKVRNGEIGLSLEIKVVDCKNNKPYIYDEDGYRVMETDSGIFKRINSIPTLFWENVVLPKEEDNFSIKNVLSKKLRSVNITKSGYGACFVYNYNKLTWDLVDASLCHCIIGIKYYNYDDVNECVKILNRRNIKPEDISEFLK